MFLDRTNKSVRDASGRKLLGRGSVHLEGLRLAACELPGRKRVWSGAARLTRRRAFHCLALFCASFCALSGTEHAESHTASGLANESTRAHLVPGPSEQPTRTGASPVLLSLVPIFAIFIFMARVDLTRALPTSECQARLFFFSFRRTLVAEITRRRRRRARKRVPASLASARASPALPSLPEPESSAGCRYNQSNKLERPPENSDGERLRPTLSHSLIQFI